MRDRNFYINSIKMDLYRVVTASGDVSKPPSTESVKEFLTHAISDFDKFQPTSLDLIIKENLIKLSKQTFKLKDSCHRLRWVEDVLTNRCRMLS